jgi:hypothetical protein
MNNWEFPSWGPWHGGVAVYDPPHGDYYSKPSQPLPMSPDEIIARDRAALEKKLEKDFDTSGLDEAYERRKAAARELFRLAYGSEEGNRRAHALIRQAYQEPTARALYFWLGRDAENF